MSETSKTVDHALRLLGAIRTEGAAPTAAIARRLGLSRTVTARLVATLTAHDLLRRTPDGIALGFGLLDLAAGLAHGVREAARAELHDLAVRFHETAVLTLADNDTAVAIDQVVPDGRVMRIHYHPGSRHSLVEAAHGRAMLAHLAPAISRLVDGQPDAAEVHAALHAVRRRGYAISRDELEQGVTGLAAPVFDPRGVAIASIGVVAPSSRFPGERTVAASVREAADRISISLTSPVPITPTG